MSLQILLILHTKHIHLDLELLQEKQNLEKSLLELSLQSKLATNLLEEKATSVDYCDKKSALTAKLETYTNRTQIPKRINKVNIIHY